jgi:hypothetical protein
LRKARNQQNLNIGSCPAYCRSKSEPGYTKGKDPTPTKDIAKPPERQQANGER